MRNTHHRFADFLLISALLLVLLASLFMTNIGAKSLVAALNAAKFGLQIEGVQGNIIQGLHVERLEWQDKRHYIALDNIKFKLAKVPYQNKRFNLKRLSAERLDIRLLPREEKRPPKTTYNIDIPNIPFPIDLYAEHVWLDSLHIYNRTNKEIFSIFDMNIHEGAIVDSFLQAKKVSAKPRITQYRMRVWLDDVSVDFMQPHAMQGHGKVKYSHILTGQFSGDAKISGTWTNYIAETSFQWKERILGKSQINLKLEGDYDGLTLSNVDLKNTAGDLTGQVELGWFKQFTWDATIFGKHVDLSRFPKAVESNLDTELKTQGGYDFEKKRWFFVNDFLSLDGEVSGFPLQSSGKLSLKEGLLSVQEFDARSGINRLKIAGQITEPFYFKWDLDARDMSQVLPRYSGLIIGKGELSGTTFAPDAKGKLSVRRLKAGDIKLDFAELDFDGKLRDANVSGYVDADLKGLAFEEVLVDKAMVKMTGAGESIQAFKGKGSVQFNHVKAPKFSSEYAHVNFDIDDRKLAVSGDLQQVQLVNQRVSKATLTGSGRMDNHKLSLRAQSSLGDLQATATGGWIEDQWRGRLDTATLKNTAAGDWALQKAGQLELGSKRVQSKEICISNALRGRGCTSLAWEKDSGISGKGRLEAMPLKQLKPWLPQALELPGLVSGIFDVKQTAEGLFGSVNLTLPENRVGVKRSIGGTDYFHYQQGVVNLRLKGKTVENQSQLIVDGRGRLESKGVLTLNKNAASPSIDNTLILEMRNLAWMQDFFPDFTNLQGSLSTVLHIKGELKNPAVTLKSSLKNGGFAIPDTGTRLSDITIQINTQAQNKANIVGSLRAGNGVLNVDGIMHIKGLNDWTADLNVQGKDLLFMNTLEVQSYVSPQLNIKATPRLVEVWGTLHVPKSTIKLDEIPEAAIYESEDVVIKGQEQKPRSKFRTRIIPHVRITLGKSIIFSGFGLESHLEGNLFVTQNKGTYLSRGTLRIVDGQYRAYGQSMEIEQGELVFNGPIGNPGLDIRATRSLNDIKVGLNLAGTLQSPKSSIFSDPPQSEDDALSYLLTGQSLSETSGNEAQLLVQAVRTLGINSGSSLLNRLGGSVGLDDVNIITYGDYKQNKLQLGKRLGSRLYIRYITGLFDAFHKIALDYTISSKWSLEAESGEGQGVDFIYEIESD